MDIKENDVKGHSVILYPINRWNKLDQKVNGVTCVSRKVFSRLPEELEPFETVPPALLNGGYSGSSHSQILISEELL